MGQAHSACTSGGQAPGSADHLAQRENGNNTCLFTVHGYHTQCIACYTCIPGYYMCVHVYNFIIIMYPFSLVVFVELISVSIIPFSMSQNDSFEESRKSSSPYKVLSPYN